MTENSTPDLREYGDHDPEAPATNAARPVLIDLSVGSVPTIEHEGHPWIVFRPTVEAIGLGYESQTQTLSRSSWATVTKRVTVAADGKARLMTIVDRRTFLGWAMGIGERRVAPRVRPALIAFQNETLDAIEAYWTKGYAVNPRGWTPEQVELIDGLLADRNMEWALALYSASQAKGRADGRYDGPDGKPLSAAARRDADRRFRSEFARAFELVCDAGLPAVVRAFRQQRAIGDAR